MEYISRYEYVAEKIRLKNDLFLGYAIYGQSKCLTAAFWK